MKIHEEKRHGNGQLKKEEICPICEKPQANVKAMKRHMETHMKCNTCGLKFDMVSEVVQHKKIHTYCSFCIKDFGFRSKLKKHVASSHKDKL